MSPASLLMGNSIGWVSPNADSRGIPMRRRDVPAHERHLLNLRLEDHSMLSRDERDAIYAHRVDPGAAERRLLTIAGVPVGALAEMREVYLELADSISNELLSDLAETALFSAAWIQARVYLDDLCRRQNTHRRLRNADEYGVPSQMYPAFQDRIDAINRKAKQ